MKPLLSVEPERQKKEKKLMKESVKLLKNVEAVIMFGGKAAKRDLIAALERVKF